jgi:hypothetical protein
MELGEVLKSLLEERTLRRETVANDGKRKHDRGSFGRLPELERET